MDMQTLLSTGRKPSKATQVASVFTEYPLDLTDLRGDHEFLMAEAHGNKLYLVVDICEDLIGYRVVKPDGADTFYWHLYQALEAY